VSIVHIIACLFALIGVVPAITLLSPVRVAHRVVPLIMIILSLVIWFLPTGVAIAMALVPVAAYISVRLGIEHAGHEPVDATKAVELAKKTAQRIQERIRKPEPLVITEFVTKDSAGVLPAEDDEPDQDEPDESPAEKVTAKLEGLTRDPALPAGLRSQLSGQRAGKIHEPGQTISAVPQYVPSLA
jgi:hypothetical protein